MRKFISILIILSISLHCLSRLGVISYAYKQRHDLAFSLGLTTDRMIAICQGEYFQDSILEVNDGVDTEFPVSLPQAQEINFATPPASMSSLEIPWTPIIKHLTFYLPGKCDSHVKGIFHPPGFLS